MTIQYPVRLFHITALANFEAICQQSALLSKNQVPSYQNIAHQNIQERRATKNVPNPPGGTIHDYVPFYFAPRSPMLFAIKSGSVKGCNVQQAEIIHLETTVEKLTEVNPDFVFYDRNASLAFSSPHTTIQELSTAIDWNIFFEQPLYDGFCQFWQNRSNPEHHIDRMEKRQAEFLIKKCVPLSQISRIGVFDEHSLQAVSRVLSQHDLTLPVEIKKMWYF